MKIGYARVSSLGQELELQETALSAAGCDRVFAEKKSGTTQRGREQLDLALSFLREGDQLIVTRLDRLARSVADLAAIVSRIEAAGASFVCTEQQIDTSSATGRLQLHMLAAFAEFETDLRAERQREGIEKAKADGKYKGRPASIDSARVQQLRDEGMGASAIAKEMGVSRATVYRLIKTTT
jgi:DNA invertase Pin-like site-specific DNA recombinase